ncbi:MAG TPA: hypothetical protein VHU87_09355 [Rhizomicrobium sp.]|jgi:hypothetical protein|nr:hypothetical protein [Rhizomicrobium sp.]
MRGSFDSPPVVIRTSRVGSAAGFAICSALGFTDLVSLIQAGWAWNYYAYFGLFLFGMGFLYFGWQLADPTALILSPDGLSWKNSFVTRHWRWQDIDNFRTMPLGAVACDFFDENPRMRRLRAFNKKAAGSQGSFGFGWEGGAANVVETLRTARHRWFPQEPAAAPSDT